jgi:hypothetical protein
LFKFLSGVAVGLQHHHLQIDVGNFKMNFYAFSRAGINAVLHRAGNVICIWRPRWLGMSFWLW